MQLCVIKLILDICDEFYKKNIDVVKKSADACFGIIQGCLCEVLVNGLWSLQDKHNKTVSFRRLKNALSDPQLKKEIDNILNLPEWSNVRKMRGSLTAHKNFNAMTGVVTIIKPTWDDIEKLVEELGRLLNRVSEKSVNSRYDLSIDITYSYVARDTKKLIDILRAAM